MSSVYDIANWIYKPNAGFKAGSHYMLKPLTGAGRVNVARASDKWCLNESAVLVKREANITPLDWLDGEDYSLIEPSAVNLIFNNKGFNTGWSVGSNMSSAWTTLAGVEARDITVVTSGSTGSSTNTLQRSQSIAITTGSTYTISFLVKKSTAHSILNIRFFDGGGNTSVVYDIDTKATSVLTNTSGHTNITPRIIDYTANGEFLIELTFTSNVTGNFTLLSIQPSNFTNSNTAGQTMVFAWTQFEQGNQSSSRIESTTASVTRQADNLSVSNVAHLIGQTQGTVFFSGNISNILTGTFLTASDGTTNNRNQILKVGDGRLRYLQVAGGSVVTSIYTGVVTNGNYKGFIKYSTTEGHKLILNGAEIGSAVASAVAGGSRLSFGINATIDGNQLTDRLGLCWGTDQLLSDEFCLEYTA